LIGRVNWKSAEKLEGLFEKLGVVPQQGCAKLKISFRKFEIGQIFETRNSKLQKHEIFETRNSKLQNYYRFYLKINISTLKNNTLYHNKCVNKILKKPTFNGTADKIRKVGRISTKK
jgi:hypothetical protein